MAVELVGAAPHPRPTEIVRDATAAQSSRAWVLALTAAASFMVALDGLVVSTALSTIRVELRASIEALEWTVNAYNLSFAVLLLTGAALGDYFGRRRLFALGLGLFTAASAACALAPNVNWLIAARALQGAGGALVMPLGLALLSAAYPREERARALGIFSGITGLALISGPVIGGAIVQGVAWQWIFWLNIPIGLVTIALAASRIRESVGPKAALDIGGVVLASGASLGLVWGLARANASGWLSPEVDAALAIGLILGVVFVLWETRVRAPMIPMRLFSSRAFSAGNAACFLFTAALFGTLFFVAQFLQTGQGFEPLAAGARMLPWTATLFFFAPLAGRLVNTVGERRLIVTGLLLQAIGTGWLALVASPDVGFIGLIAPFIIAGAGVSIAMPAAQNAVVSAVTPTEIGKASGTYQSLRFLGGAFGVAINATVFAAVGGFSSPQLFATGFAAAIGVSAALALAGALVGLLVPGHSAAPSPA